MVVSALDSMEEIANPFLAQEGSRFRNRPADSGIRRDDEPEGRSERGRRRFSRCDEVVLMIS